MARIAISLSGGGFRAATFHLGSLSYLNHLRTAGGTPLLDHIAAVSTISGGTLTGLWFILGKCRGWSNDESLARLARLLLKGDIIDRASREFLCGANKNNSLIREMVKIYDEDIFEGATLGDLMDKIDVISIDDFSANATEFNNATEFRFQVGKAVKTEKKGTSRGIVGNAYNNIPLGVARQIRLAEVFAASSCFPGGFEPLFFPRDFQFSRNEANAEALLKLKHVALMDGGVVDNQGIEPINLIRNRKDLDLFIISDAGRGHEKPYDYQESRHLPWLTVHRINVTLNVAIIVVAQFLLWVPQGFWTGFFLGLTLIFLTMRVATALASRRLIKRYARQVPFSFNWKELLHIPVSKYINLIASRATSMLTLTDKVFMNHIRSLNYDTIYNDPRWQNRRIMNALYELCSARNWSKNLKDNKAKGQYIVSDEELRLMEPSDAINQTSDNAADMATTLWWSADDRQKGKPQALAATGQYTLCWNLLEYIYRLQKDTTNLGPQADTIISLQAQLEDDWRHFKKDPLWLLNELGMTE